MPRFDGEGSSRLTFCRHHLYVCKPLIQRQTALTKSVESSSRVKNLMQAHIVAIAAPQTAEDNRR